MNNRIMILLNYKRSYSTLMWSVKDTEKKYIFYMTSVDTIKNIILNNYLIHVMLF